MPTGILVEGKKVDGEKIIRLFIEEVTMSVIQES